MTISAAEQYLIELINRARLDPIAEAAHYGIDLNDNLAEGTIGTDPLQVLAINGLLSEAADEHSVWMLENNVFSHTGVNNTSPGARMADAGYVFEGAWQWSENLAWTGTTGSLDLAEAVDAHHEGLFRSSGHRTNTFDEDVREIGVAQVAGNYEIEGASYNSSMLTEQFALSGETVFVTGVAFVDTDADAFYSIGEGIEGIKFVASGEEATTSQAGGYALGLDGVTEATVDIMQGNTTLGRVNLDMRDGNVKVDVVVNGDGDYALALSGNANLGGGINDAYLLGAGDLNLMGNAEANVLTGNRGNNVLSGGDGCDRLVGGNGSDRLYGGDMGDRLYGGNGRDVLVGGDGYDRLYGGNYHDRLYGGTASDRLYGGGGNDWMVGGNGHDRLYGSYGHDRMYGNGGSDRLYGGGGRDLLNGGAGNDLMVGGAGADTFVFNGGDDVIADFTFGDDRLYITDRLYVDGDALDYAEVTNDAIVFTFSEGNTLTLSDVTDLSLLADYLI